MSDKKIAILINTCDAFEDCWDLFFAGISNCWSDCSLPIYLNTQSSTYCNEKIKDLKVFTSPEYKEKDCWGKRLINTLQKIDSPYVIMLLEDFVLSAPVNSNIDLDELVEEMENDKSIGVIYLHHHPSTNVNEPWNQIYGKLPQKCDYKLTTQPGLWRKDYLLECIKGIENPWEWEVYRSKYAWHRKEKEYALLNSENNFFHFAEGGVIGKGKWRREVVELAKEYNINIDFQKRGFFESKNRGGDVYSIKKNFPKDIFKAVFWRLFFDRIYKSLYLRV
ncbi:hypothetical protein SAMN04487830_1193 [Pseudobutyrivibrio sp. OR37]|uniref:hypothetical protein n=1 Tax=Pseudobutyrivibrio sp. OR37 TaxID=1798186 RepID=UPI0008F1F852|nr:hypothetical protein [Pseudobutyrivibrio sp. OR37]SFI04003.1 hypothetical protein SAMN04487830_1193 [Pseudobutyrivibrio sp. OR37]